MIPEIISWTIQNAVFVTSSIIPVTMSRIRLSNSSRIVPNIHLKISISASPNSLATKIIEESLSGLSSSAVVIGVIINSWKYFLNSLRINCLTSPRIPELAAPNLLV